MKNKLKNQISKFCFLAMIPLLSISFLYAQNQNTDWFKNAKYGIFVHFLPSGKDFQKEINDFDANAFAQDCYDTGAGYVFFTVGQNSGYYCLPNAKYDQITGHKAGERCSTRDLPMEIANALNKKGIRFMLYAPGDAPAEDSVAAKALGAKDFVKNENGENWVYNKELIKNWGAVLQEWSDRYGPKVAGWWIDGCYTKSGFTNDFGKSLSQNLKHGNPKSIVALNSGLNYDKISIEDYLAGEERNLLGAECKTRFSNGAQWHELSFLGKDWGSGEPTCNSTQLYDYLKNKINKNGGVLTMDVRMEGSHIAASHLKVLKELKGMMRH